MKFYTTIYPIFINENSDGTFEYGFLTGERLNSVGLFSDSDVVRCTFNKKQKFTFLTPIKAQVISPNELNEQPQENVNRRLFPRINKPVVRLVGDNLDNLQFSIEASEDNE